LSKKKSLKKTIRALFFEKEVLQKSNNKFHRRIETLEKEEIELRSKYGGLEKVVLKFSKRQDNLDKLLGSQRMSFNKEGIWYKPFDKTKHAKISLLKRHPKKYLTPYAIII